MTANIECLQELDDAHNLAISVWGSKELANFMCQDDDYNSEELNNEEIPEGAVLDNSGLYYWVKNKASWGESRWRTKKQLHEMEKRIKEEEKVGMWKKYSEMSTQEWNNALMVSSKVKELRYKLLS